MEYLQIVVFGVGVALLIGGAWALIGGGSRVAAVLGVPPVVVGLTVVAFGTSAPELFVSLVGAIRGNTGLVLGNVIGSNVANVGLILSLAAVMRPVKVEWGLTKREVPFMLGASTLFLVLVWDGLLSRPDAGVLAAGFAVFIGWTLHHRERGVVPPPMPVGVGASRPRELAKGLCAVAIGVVGLALGGQLIVSSSLAIAGALGVSETLIGLTMVAVGTSLPELATTIVAAVRDQDDLALGNIVGSNIFNLLGVAAPVGLMRPLRVEAAGAAGETSLMGPLHVQLVSMLLISLVVFAMIAAGRGSIGRGRGAILLMAYGGIMYVWTTLA